MSAHTPGPWSYFMPGSTPATNPEQAAFVIGPTTRCMDRSVGYTLDDARLIAAAPDLLEALMACRDELVSLNKGIGWRDGEWHEVTLANAAIAKATGADT